MDVATLAAFLREAEDHHGAYEAAAPPHHWSNWYAPYIVARLQGLPSEQAVEEATRSAERVPG